MIHYLNWEIINYWDLKILKNNSFWVKIFYFGTENKWDFFLHPIIDDNHHTIYYFAFDNKQQLEIFLKLTKISGIWWKTWCYIATWYDIETIQKAIKENDIKFFKQIPWIWPKTAKKIIIELKDKISLDEFEKQDENEILKNKIISAISWLWYNKQKIEKVLKTYKWDLKDTQQVMKDILKQL